MKRTLKPIASVGKFNIPCQTNCKHWFCSSCILKSWNPEDPVRTIKCPTCGLGITMLVPSKNEKPKNHGAPSARILEQIETYKL